MVFHSAKRSFKVQEDGTFAWREFDDGSLKIDGSANYFGTQTRHWASHRALLRAAGTATATPTPPGSPRPYQRRLEIHLEYSGGSGAWGDNHGGAGAYVVDDAGEQMTVTGPTTTTMALTWWQSKWSLNPARTVREEFSPDEVRETTTYEGTRPAEITTQNSGKYKVTERIEIRHVRYLNLVPRG
jgi:hypothetical protein